MKESQHNAIKELIKAFEENRGSKIKFLHINGLDCAVKRNKQNPDVFDIDVSEKKKPVHNETGVHLETLYSMLCEILESEDK